LKINRACLVWAAVAFLALVMVPAIAGADGYLKIVNDSEAYEMMGQKVPARVDTTIIWYSDGKIRTDQGDTATILINTEKNMLYFIDHSEKAYMEIPLDILGDLDKMIESQAASEEEAESMKKMMEGMKAMMKLSITVTPSDEKEKIKDYNCTRYTMTTTVGANSQTADIWATEDIKVDYGLLRTSQHAYLMQLPGADEAMKEMEKIKGLTVKSTSTSTVGDAEIKTNSELLEYKETEAPKGTFEIPEGYEKLEGGMMGGR